MTPLDELTDELTDILVEVNDRLVAAKLGVTAEVVLPPRKLVDVLGKGERTFRAALCFKQHDREWGLWIRTVNDADQEEYMVIARAPRLYRTQAADALPELLRELQNKTRHHANEMTIARDKARSFLLSLKEHGL